MPYSQFTTLRSIKQKFGIHIESNALFSEIPSTEPSHWLLETLHKSSEHQVALFSEKSRSEAIVFPILVELKEIHKGRFRLYSGANVEADKENGLNGECDFVLGLGEQNMEMETPIFTIVEAKDNDIEVGIPQFIAQLLGSQILNEQDGIRFPAIYGEVTTGVEWQFLSLSHQGIVLDVNRFYIANLPNLLGMLSQIISVFITNE